MMVRLSRHTRSILVVAFALAVAGVFAGIALPVGLFPQVSFPRVLIDVDAGSRPADQMALLVTRPVEQAVRDVPGVQNVRSSSTRGTAQIAVDFGWGRDMTTSTLLVESAIQQVLPDLPAGVGYTVRRMIPQFTRSFPTLSPPIRSVRWRCATSPSTRWCRCCPPCRASHASMFRAVGSLR